MVSLRSGKADILLFEMLIHFPPPSGRFALGCHSEPKVKNPCKGKRGHSTFLLQFERPKPKMSFIPRAAGASVSRFCYHGINRGTRGVKVSRTRTDYYTLVDPI